MRSLMYLCGLAGSSALLWGQPGNAEDSKEKTRFAESILATSTSTSLVGPSLAPPAQEDYATIEDDNESGSEDGGDPGAPRFIGMFDVTFYWVAEEDPTSSQRRLLLDQTCRPLARVSRDFARKLTMEGTGRTRSGKILNVHGPCQCKHQTLCYAEIDEESPWGLGVAREPLSPFRSIAVDPDVMPIGTAVYMPALDGVRMPGAKPWGDFIHDGCLKAADRGGNVRGMQIDVFAGLRSHFLLLARDFAGAQIEVHEGASHCDRFSEERLSGQRLPTAPTNRSNGSIDAKANPKAG